MRQNSCSLEFLPHFLFIPYSFLHLEYLPALSHSDRQIYDLKDHSYRSQLKKHGIHEASCLAEIQSDPARQRIQKPDSFSVETVQYKMRCKTDHKIKHQLHRYHGYRRTQNRHSHDRMHKGSVRLIFAEGAYSYANNDSHSYRCHRLVIPYLFPHGKTIKIIQCDLSRYKQNRDQCDPVCIFMRFRCSHINITDQCPQHSCSGCEYHPGNCRRLCYGQHRSKSHCCVCFTCHNFPLCIKKLLHEKGSCQPPLLLTAAFTEQHYITQKSAILSLIFPLSSTSRLNGISLADNSFIQTSSYVRNEVPYREFLSGASW